MYDTDAENPMRAVYEVDGEKARWLETYAKVPIREDRYVYELERAGRFKGFPT